MKFPKVFSIAAIAAAAVLATNNVSAVMGPVNISAKATFEQDFIVSSGNDVFKPANKSFKTADALLLLANATGENWFTDKSSQLVFDPDAYNAEASAQYESDVYGIFWVTNKTTHAAFRLDGDDGLGNYWSYVEWDFSPWVLGFSSLGPLDLNSVSSGKYVASPYQYSNKITGNGTFYIHDNPYDFDYPDFQGSVVFDNNFAVVLTGTMTYSFNYKYDSKSDSYPVKNSLSLKGSGDGIWLDDVLLGQGYLPQPVFSGGVKHSDSGKEDSSVLLPDPLGGD